MKFLLKQIFLITFPLFSIFFFTGNILGQAPRATKAARAALHKTPYLTQQTFLSLRDYFAYRHPSYSFVTRAARLPVSSKTTDWLTETIQVNVPPLILPMDKTLNILRQPTLLRTLTPEQKEALYLNNFPALAIESQDVPTPAQIEQALEYYKHILTDIPFGSTQAEIVDNWGKAMAAVTNLGFFGTPRDAKAILSVSKRDFPEKLTGWTDLITVRALLNLGGYQEIRNLAHHRLAQVDSSGQPKKLPAVWKHIQEYMTRIDQPLALQNNRIETTLMDPVMPYSVQKSLSKYNRYNLLHVDASVEVTQHWLNLRLGMYENLASHAVKRLMQEKFPIAIPTQSPSIPQAGIHARIQETLRLQYEKALKKEQLCLQKLHNINHSNLHSLSPQEQQKIWEQTWGEWYDANEELQAIISQQNQVQRELARGADARHIARLTVGDLAQSSSITFKFQQPSFKIVNGFLQSTDTSYFEAAVSSLKEAEAKQQLLSRSYFDYAAANHLLSLYQQQWVSLKQLRIPLGQEQQRQDDIKQLEKRGQNMYHQLLNAKNKRNYIEERISDGTDFTTIYQYVYGKNSLAYTSDQGLWSAPKIPFIFRGSGPDFPSFESQVSSRAEGEEKQEILNYAAHHYQSAKKHSSQTSAWLRWQESHPLQNHSQQIRLLTQIRQEFHESTLKLEKTRDQMQNVYIGLQQGKTIDQILKQVYGYSPIPAGTPFEYQDLTAPAGFPRGFMAPASSHIDFEIKQNLLNEIALKYNRTREMQEKLQQQIASLQKHTSILGRGKRRRLLESYQTQAEQNNMALTQIRSQLVAVQNGILQGLPSQKIREQLNKLLNL